MMGFLLLIGVVVTNAVVLIVFVEQLRAKGFSIYDAIIEGVINSLEYREKGGYRREKIEILLCDRTPSRVKGVVYIATPGNPNYLGPAPLDEIAAQVLRSEGPSGHNVEYVTRLAASLRLMDADDAHVFGLERLVIGVCKVAPPQ